jgi:predicted enzyme related to lactoylglutathione lyase
MSTTITGLGQLGITVKDVQLALPFYTKVLGLQFLFAPTEQLAFVQSGATRLMLSTARGAGEVAKNSIPYFQTTAIEQFYTEALQRGAVGERAPALAAQMPDHQLWIAFLKDPDGNLIGLMEEKR